MTLYDDAKKVLGVKAVVILALAGLFLYYVYPKIWPHREDAPLQGVTLPSFIPPTASEPREKCLVASFSDEQTRNQWDFRNYNNPDKNGFYEPRRHTDSAPEIWFKEPIPIIFSSLEIRYMIQSDKNDLVPSFALSLGHEPSRISKFYAPSEEAIRVGLDIFTPENQRNGIRGPKFKLEAPIEENREIILKVDVAQGDMITYHYSLEYFSGGQLRRPPPISFTFPLEIPRVETSKMKVESLHSKTVPFYLYLIGFVLNDMLFDSYFMTHSGFFNSTTL